MPSKRPKSDKKATKLAAAQPRPVADPFQELKDDAEFQEFLSVQRNADQKQKSYVWANDVHAFVSDPADAREDENEDHDPGEDDRESKTKKDFTQSEYTIKLRELPFKSKKGEIKKWFAPLTVTRVKLPGRIPGIAYVSFKTQADMQQGMQKHKSILNGHQVLISAHTADEKRQQAPAPEPKPYHVIKESVADTGRLYVRNLSYTCTSQALEDLFSPFGQLTEIYLPIDGTTKKVKGFAFVTFMFPEHAIVAMDSLDKTKFQERLIHILPGESKPDKFAHLNNLSSFKQKKETELLQDRNKALTWNTLFLGANAAADVMSAKYNVKKSDLIADQNTSDSIAVRMALGETQIVNETKTFLIENGINLNAFTQEVIHEGVNPNEVLVRKRSKTVILVKNLPVSTTAEEVGKIFARHGIVMRVILPVHGVTAIIEMQEEVEAKKAFNSLINYKLNHAPIYLEWAPVDVFRKKNSESASKDNTSADREGVNTAPGDQVEEEKINPPSDRQPQHHQAEEDQRSISAAGMMAGGFRLFVKNVSFRTTDESFERHFKSGSLVSAAISRKKGSAGLSNGYGFVVYQTSQAAEKALKSLQNSMLDGHCLQVQRSHVR